MLTSVINKIFRQFPEGMKRINLDLTSARTTPLHIAAENGCLEICEFILKNVEDKEPRTTNGRTPLVIAAENRHFNVCILIASYCDFF